MYSHLLEEFGVLKMRSKCIQSTADRQCIKKEEIKEKVYGIENLANGRILFIITISICQSYNL